MTSELGSLSMKPPIASRVAVGVVLLVILLVLLVGLPIYLVGRLSGFGVTSDLPLAAISTGGAVLAALWALAYMVKPTRAYGPVSAARAVAAIVYLVVFAPFGAVHAHLMGAAIDLTYGDLFLVFLALPVLGLAAAAVTTYEDARHPFERLPFDFPPR
ncbi:MAG TPA: hypothetical protein VFF67_05975 [Thermoplasmata archaeon]|nr:hypothetical protein [Thermoplasmata archaeon]